MTPSTSKTGILAKRPRKESLQKPEDLSLSRSARLNSAVTSAEEAPPSLHPQLRDESGTSEEVTGVIREQSSVQGEHLDETQSCNPIRKKTGLNDLPAELLECIFKYCLVFKDTIQINQKTYTYKHSRTEEELQIPRLPFLHVLARRKEFKHHDLLGNETVVESAIRTFYRDNKFKVQIELKSESSTSEINGYMAEEIVRKYLQLWLPRKSHRELIRFLEIATPCSPVAPGRLILRFLTNFDSVGFTSLEKLKFYLSISFGPALSLSQLYLRFNTEKLTVFAPVWMHRRSRFRLEDAFRTKDGERAKVVRMV